MAGTRVPGVRGNLDGKLFRVEVDGEGTFSIDGTQILRWGEVVTMQ